GSLILRQPPGRRETASSDCLAGGYQRIAPSGSGNPLRRRPYQPDGDRFRMDRRRFLQGAAALAGAAFWRIPAVRSEPPATARLRLLVLGGTSSLGPALVREAVVAGHTVTLFNRGITNPELFPRLEKLRGLRSANASEEKWDAVGTRRFDAIVD